MIMRHNRERKLEEDRRKMEAMKQWNLQIQKTNQKKIADERRLKEIQRHKFDDCIRAQEEEKKQKQMSEIRLKELQRQKLEEIRKSQEKMKEEKERRIQENEKRKKETWKKKQEEAAKLREEERMRRDFRRKLAQEQRDQDEQRRIDEEIGRWRREENNRRSREARMKIPIYDQLKLECQRQKVEEVMRMSSELVLKGSERSRAGTEDSTDSEDCADIPTPIAKHPGESDDIPTPIAKHPGESDEETRKEHQQDQQYILRTSQQEQEEESRREAQQARYKRHQEERQCRTLEDDLQKLMQKASALATLVDDAESVGTLDEFDLRESFEGRRETENSLRDNKMRNRKGAGYARKDVPLCADQYEGMTYLYNRLEEEKSKQFLSKKPKGGRLKPKKQLGLPKNCGLPYAKSLSNRPARGVLENIPFLKFDGSPCFGHGDERHYVIKR